MRRYLLRRVLHAVPVVFGVVTVVFLLVHLLPGDPVEILLGESAMPAQKKELRREMHLDRPVLVQYAEFLSGLPRGNLGTSFRSREPVAREIARRFPATLLLASTSIAVAAVTYSFFSSSSRVARTIRIISAAIPVPSVTAGRTRCRSVP